MVDPKFVIAQAVSSNELERTSLITFGKRGVVVVWESEEIYSLRRFVRSIFNWFFKRESGACIPDEKCDQV